MYQARLAAIAADVRQGRWLLGPHTQDEAADDDYAYTDIQAALLAPACEVIEEYSDDARGASCLLLSWVGNRPIHLVVTTPPRLLFVITVYDPSRRPEKWSADFRRRTT